jgi:hypothetical protein
VPSPHTHFSLCAVVFLCADKRSTHCPHTLYYTLNTMLPLLVESLSGLASFCFLYLYQERPLLSSLLTSLFLGYLPQYFNGLEKKGGNHWAVSSYSCLCLHLLSLPDLLFTLYCWHLLAPAISKLEPLQCHLSTQSHHHHRGGAAG